MVTSAPVSSAAGGGGEVALESGRVADDVVGGQHDHRRARVAPRHPADGQGDGGGGVALGRFGDDVFRRQVGEHLAHGGFLVAVGEDQDAFGRDEALQPVRACLPAATGRKAA